MIRLSTYNADSINHLKMDCRISRVRRTRQDDKKCKYYFASNGIAWCSLSHFNAFNGFTRKNGCMRKNAKTFPVSKTRRIGVECIALKWNENLAKVITANIHFCKNDRKKNCSVHHRRPLVLYLYTQWETRKQNNSNFQTQEQEFFSLSSFVFRVCVWVLARARVSVSRSSILYVLLSFAGCKTLFFVSADCDTIPCVCVRQSDIRCSVVQRPTS